MLTKKQLEALESIQASLVLIEQHRRSINGAVHGLELPILPLSISPQLGQVQTSLDRAIFNHDLQKSKAA